MQNMFETSCRDPNLRTKSQDIFSYGVFRKCTKMLQLSKTGGKTAIIFPPHFSAFSKKVVKRITMKFLLVKILVFQSLSFYSLDLKHKWQFKYLTIDILTFCIVRCIILQITWVETSLYEMTEIVAAALPSVNCGSDAIMRAYSFIQLFGRASVHNGPVFLSLNICQSWGKRPEDIQSLCHAYCKHFIIRDSHLMCIQSETSWQRQSQIL